MAKIIKLNLPQWQGGLNPNYVLGNQIMQVIVPQTQEMATINVPVNFDFNDKTLSQNEGVNQSNVLAEQFKAASAALKIKDPDKVITIGGDCSSSLASFNYLSGKYGQKLGMIWLDAHPDISDNNQTHNLFEMVVAILMGQGPDSFKQLITHPLAKRQVLLAGLIAESLRPMDDKVKKWEMNYLTPEDLRPNAAAITDWLTNNHFSAIAVHWDLDVLDYRDFRSIYPAEPHTEAKNFPAAVGKLQLAEVISILQKIEENSQLVGLTLAEHLPWDAIRLQKGLKKLNLFN